MYDFKFTAFKLVEPPGRAGQTRLFQNFIGTQCPFTLFLTIFNCLQLNSNIWYPYTFHYINSVVVINRSRQEEPWVYNPFREALIYIISNFHVDPIIRSRPMTIFIMNTQKSSILIIQKCVYTP